MKRPLRPCAGLAFMAAAGVISTGAPCAAQTGADQAIQHGLELRRARQDEEALAEFRRALALEPTPRARAQIALAEQALGRWRDAEVDLGAALATGDDAWVVANHALLEAARAEIDRRLATLRVTSNVQGAKLRIDDGPLVSLPQVLRVQAGALSLRVEAPGFAPVHRVLTVTEGAVVDENFTLIAFAPLPASTCPTPQAVAVPQPLPLRSPARATWGWVTLGAAAAPLVFGVIESVVRNQDASIYDNDARCPQGYKDAVCGGERTGAETAMVLSVVGYMGAASLAAVGTVLLLTSRDKVSVAAWPAPGGGVAGLRGRF